MPKLPCVLLVDDDPITNFLNQRLLDELHLTEKLLIALNGKEAIALLQEHCAAAEGCPVLILLDVNMPVMNGFDFLDAYAELPLARQHSSVVIMLSTSLHPRDVQRVEQLHIGGFLNKPLTREKVHTILSQHFGQLLN
ncbi:response regulator [Hymenobacter chitinivorans]|uniref:Response regulator receiver domain-containing protein n=1 Tax=Hymenobacter chitinivorans DSM 11115 TaxID=1121954 RepID=A0A2M9BMC8_9BACT|nr:response regulator [Hymenobacter chitinivorans]PJJ59085.1 response regulator receiver domain-containing protein [Hymenobacter chitinivorans DSM 11115]